jgi:hypothetical protein
MKGEVSFGEDEKYSIKKLNVYYMQVIATLMQTVTNHELYEKYDHNFILSIFIQNSLLNIIYSHLNS